MDEMYLTRLGEGNYDTGFDKALAELTEAGYQFFPGAEGYEMPDGFRVTIYRHLPFWMQVAKAHKTWRERQGHGMCA
ncbi:MAG: hypothetical protein FJZ89_12795 [Chloroflexi bacterium]|nr:hypothetical protein [Chloroflexota bacterium]